VGADPAFGRALEAARHLDDPDPPWQDVLEGFRCALGGDSATLILIDGQGGLLHFQQRGVDAAAVQAYAHHYFSQDIVTPIAAGAACGTWFDTAQLFTPGQLTRSPYYVDFMCRHRMRQMVTYIVEDSPQRHGGLTVQRSHASDRIRHQIQTQAMHQFAAAIMRALARRERTADRWFTHADAALASFDEAICLTTTRGLVVRRSQGAQALLEGGRVLHEHRGQLRHALDTISTALQAAMQRAVTDTTPVTLDVPDATGIAHRIALARAHPGLCISGERLVLLRLPMAHRPSAQRSLHALRVAFRLTAAEAAVLDALMRGRSARQYAEERQVSYHTVRSQIAALMQKTGCTRQVDLVREGLRVVPASE